ICSLGCSLSMSFSFAQHSISPLPFSLLTFIIVAFKCNENNKPSFLARTNCSSKKRTNSAALKNVPSSTSPAFNGTLSFSTCTRSTAKKPAGRLACAATPHLGAFFRHQLDAHVRCRRHRHRLLVGKKVALAHGRHVRLAVARPRLVRRRIL